MIQPETLAVLALPNQYGDAPLDLCVGISGSMGPAPGANIGDRRVFLEASPGAAPDIAGLGVANPIALILSGARLLGHLGEAAAERRIWESVARIRKERWCLTANLGRQARTTDLTRAIMGALC
jgi:isocitrate dehydrogenase (NAD+)